MNPRVIETGQPHMLAACSDRQSTAETYEVLVSQHLHMLRKWVTGKLRNAYDADDVVQQTLLLALRHFEQFRYEASFGTWLCKIALNEIRGRIRCAGYRRMVFVDPQIIATWGLKDPGHSQLAEIERKEVHKRLRQTINELPESYRSVLDMRDMRGLTIQETAASMRLSVPAIKSRLLRARKMLRKAHSNP